MDNEVELLRKRFQGFANRLIPNMRTRYTKQHHKGHMEIIEENNFPTMCRLILSEDCCSRYTPCPNSGTVKISPPTAAKFLCGETQNPSPATIQKLTSYLDAAEPIQEEIGDWLYDHPFYGKMPDFKNPYFGIKKDDLKRNGISLDDIAEMDDVSDEIFEERLAKHYRHYSMEEIVESEKEEPLSVSLEEGEQNEEDALQSEIKLLAEESRQPVGERQNISGIQNYRGSGLLDSYSYDVPEGAWEGRLDLHAWGKSTNLLCFFTDIKSGEKYRLSVFSRGGYCPNEGGPELDKEQVGSVFKIKTSYSKNGKPKFMSAEKLP